MFIDFVIDFVIHLVLDLPFGLLMDLLIDLAALEKDDTWAQCSTICHHRKDQEILGKGL